MSAADVRHARPGLLARLTRRAPAVRRQRDPFATAAVCSPRRCLNGVVCYAPVCYGTSGYGRADSQEPHGIATRETLAGIVAQAQAEAEQVPAPPWGPWDYPGSFPDALRGTPGWYGHSLTAPDQPPAHSRPYIPGEAAPSAASFRDDFRDLPVFRAAARAAGHAPAGRVRGGGKIPALPDFRIGELMHANFAGMDAMHPGREAA